MAHTLLSAALVVAFLSTVAGVAYGSDEAPDRTRRIVVLPFDDFSGSEDAAVALRAKLADAISEKGWTVVDLESVEPLLAEHRVRYLDSLNDDVRKQLLDVTVASAVVSGSLYSFKGGRKPLVAVSARMVGGDGSAMWGNVAGATSDDTERAFGFGRESTEQGIAASTIERLARDFPPAPGTGFRPPRFSKPLFLSSPHVYTAPLEGNPRFRVCVLPFANYSKSPEAPLVVSSLLTLRLASSKRFDVVEPATLRAAALQARIGSFRTLNSAILRAVADELGTPYFITGSVFQYSESGNDRMSTPTVEFEFSLTDVRTGEILWTTQHRRKGSDYSGFLLLGTISNVVSLTDRAVGEMIDLGETGLGKNARPVGANHARLQASLDKSRNLDTPSRKERNR